MIQSVVTNQKITIILSQEVIGGQHLIHVLPHELGSYHIISHFLQVGGELGWALVQSY